MPGYDDEGVALLEEELLLSGVLEAAFPAPEIVLVVVEVVEVVVAVGLSLSVLTRELLLLLLVLLLLWCWVSTLLVPPFMVAAPARRFPRGFGVATVAGAEDCC